jgi:hypothetical protein
VLGAVLAEETEEVPDERAAETMPAMLGQEVDEADSAEAVTQIPARYPSDLAITLRNEKSAVGQPLVRQRLRRKRPAPELVVIRRDEVTDGGEIGFGRLANDHVAAPPASAARR